MKFLHALLMASGLPLCARSQSSSITLPPHPPAAVITAAEYALDGNPAFGGGTPVGLGRGTSVNGNFSATVPPLSAGVHSMLFRVKDASGSWSLTNFRNLYVVNPNLNLPYKPTAQAINYLEYFFDTDPGRGNGIQLPVTSGTSVSASVGLDITMLSTGVHRVFFRTRDVAGSWSLTNIRQTDIIVQSLSLPAHPVPGNVTALEYFFDTDPGWGNGTVVAVPTTNSLSNFSLAADISALGSGPHTLFVRTLAQRSITNIFPFSISSPLSVGLIRAGVEREGADVRVSWRSTAERDGENYTVERSVDGRNFEMAVGIAARGGAENEYALLDVAATRRAVEKLYYRIRISGASGHETFSAVMTVALGTESNLASAYLYPNPASAEATLVMSGSKAGTAFIRLTDVFGRVLRQFHQSLGRGENRVTIPISDMPVDAHHVLIEAQGEQRCLRLMKR